MNERSEWIEVTIYLIGMVPIRIGTCVDTFDPMAPLVVAFTYDELLLEDYWKGEKYVEIVINCDNWTLIECRDDRRNRNNKREIEIRSFLDVKAL